MTIFDLRVTKSIIMKNLILILGLMVGPFIASANYSLDDGKYFNHAVGKKVKINCTGSSIKVKGLINYDWTKFRSQGHRVYSDRRGNTLRVIGHNRFEFRARGRNRVMVFYRDRWVDRVQHQYYNTSCGPSCGSSCTINHGYSSTYGGGYQGGYSNAGQGGYGYSDGGYGQGGYADGRSLEGVWGSSKYDRDVIVEQTNEGLRAKIIGSNRDWVYYRQDSYDKKEYYDNRGNRYVVRSSRELVWYPEQGGSPIVLRRLR